MKSYALITGASSGIGLELARVFAENKINLIIVARNGEKLQELKIELETKHSIEVNVFVYDLTDLEQCRKLCEDIERQNLIVEYLINNAGFGHYGLFHETNPDVDISMIRLNVESLTYLTHRIVKPMIQQKRGTIVNVASTAGFIPGPFMATYFATKNYVVALSLALAVELKPHGIHVMVLCPGPTASNFAKAANIKGSDIFNPKIPTSRQVAEFAFASIKKKKNLAIHGAKNRFTIWLSRFMPRTFLANMVGKAQKSSE
ncbi:MAG TPA: SDR family oxidoreductase [Salinivirgaceae bacterium]|nr:SDR family oxidoreductase [Salinivirgaceae bacterium]